MDEFDRYHAEMNERLLGSGHLGISDDKCNREQTSQRARPHGGAQRVMGETVRPLGA